MDLIASNWYNFNRQQSIDTNLLSKWKVMTANLKHNQNILYKIDDFILLLDETLWYMLKEDFVNDIAFTGSQVKAIINYIDCCAINFTTFPNLRYRCDYLLKMLDKNPWENAVLDKICTSTLDIANISSNEFRYFINEGSWVISARVRALCVYEFYDTARCLAKKYLNACQSSAVNLKANISFSLLEYHFIYDSYIVLLVQVGKQLEAVYELKLLDICNAANYLNRNIVSFKIVKQCALYQSYRMTLSLALNVFILTSMSQRIILSCDYNNLSFIIEQWIENNYNEIDFLINIEKILLHGQLKIQFYLFAEKLYDKCLSLHSDLIIRCYIRGLVLDINFLEEMRVNKKCSSELLYKTKVEISHRLKFVANIIKDDFHVHRECILTIFSVDPTEDNLNEIILLAGQGSHNNNNNNDDDNLDNFLNCKTLTNETSKNLMMLCHHMQMKTLSWNLPVEKLLDNCKDFIAKTKIRLHQK